MDQANFPWRQLGALLVDDELLTAEELERALAEQRRTGRLLGEILVEHGSMTGVGLAQALARQHGVELRPVSDREPEATTSSPAPAPPEPARPWRSLGTLLVLNGLVTESALQEALTEKRADPDRRLGEILVERGHLSAAALASALAEQHGVSLETQLAEDVLSARPAAREGPTYRVCVVAWEPDGERRTVLYEGANLLDAADFACEYVDREQPPAVEIERRDGADSETVWTYSQERAEAEAASNKALVETFGFDPTRWGVNT